MIPVRVHGIIDYVAGLALIAAPYLFGFATGGAAQWVAQVVGVLTLIVSLVTAYPLGIVKLVPFRIHLMLDAAMGVVLVLSPFVLGFANEVLWPHVVAGAIYLLVPALSRRDTEQTLSA